MAWEKIKRYEASTPIAIEEGMIDNDPPIYEPIYEYHIPNALVNGYGYITKNFKNIEETTSPRHRGSIPFTSIISNYFLKKKIHLDRPAISIANGWCDSYYHFVSECLIKLFLLEKYLPEGSILFPKSKFKKFHQEWFDLLGFSDILLVDDREIVKVDSCISTNFSERDLNFHKEITLEFRNWVYAKLEQKNLIYPKNNYPDKIFINREFTSYRKIINISDCLPLLSGSGYETINLENYTVIEQLNFFIHAKKIIGIHGAGFTNLLVSKADIVDIIARNFHQLCFYKLCKAIDIPYQFLKSEEVPNKVNLNSSGHADLLVDINLLQKIISL